VLQDPTTYSVSGLTLTFSTAPPSGTGNISCRYLGIPASGVTTTAYRTVTEFTATAGQTTFTPASYTVGFIDVYRNGTKLGTADYTATTGTTVVLATGAASGDLVTTVSFYVSSVLNAIPATSGAVSSAYIQNSVALTTPTLSTPTITGQATIPTINLTGGQIAFPITQSASSDANTLDDYEEGSWTPIDGSGAGLSLTVNAAAYVKIGRMVYITCSITYPATGSGAGAQIGGMPFTVESGTPTNGYWGGITRYTGNSVVVMAATSPSSTVFALYIGSGTQCANSYVSGLRYDFVFLYRATA
jgi:hypothetical protein